MTKKNILMGLTYYLPNISGVTQYAVILAEELVKRNYKVTVVTSRHKAELEPIETIEGVKVKRIGGFPLGKGFIMPGFFFQIFREVRAAETVIVHLPSIEAIFLVLWAKILGKKTIAVHHCEFQFSGPWSNRLTAALSYPLHFLIYPLADVVIGYTEDYAKHSLFLKNLKNIHYLMPPILLEDSKKKLEIKASKIVGFVGRIAWEKGLNVLLETIPKVEKEFPGVKYVLVGPYSDLAGDKSFEKLKGTLEKYQNQAILFGPLSRQELKSFYKICDVLSLPSTDNLETFGIVQAEAMICGVPVVASNLPGVRVPVKMTRMGLIAQVGDSDDLADKLIEVLKKGKNYYQKQAQNLNKFNYVKTIDEYEKII